MRSVVAVIACVSALAGCLIGAGDDSFLSAMGDGGEKGGAGDAGDARAADGPVGDGRAGDGGLEAAVMDAARVDATVQDSSAPGSQDATFADTGVQNVADAGGVPAAGFSPAPIAFGFVGCGTMGAQTLNVRNNGGGMLGVSAKIIGPAYNGSTPVFAVSPSILVLAHGQSVSLTITATVASNAGAAEILAGSLNLFTTDPNNVNVAIALSATTSGATLVVQQAPTAGGGQASAATFPATKVGTPAAPIDFWIVNNGNAPQTFSLGPVTMGPFSVDQIPAAGAMITLTPYQTWKGTARYTPTAVRPNGADNAGSTVSIISGTVCESVEPLTALSFTGKATLGSVTSDQAAIKFPPAPCGGDASAPQTFNLINNGQVPVTLGPPLLQDDAGLSSEAGFVVNLPSNTIPPDSGITVTVAAPPFPSQMGDGGTKAGIMPAAISATLTFPSDSLTPIQPIPLTEEPLGASLIFDTKAPPDAGVFGQFVLPVALSTSSPPQTFGVINKGSVASVADVTLVVTQIPAPDGGADASADAMAIAGTPSPFTVDNSAVSATQGQAEQQRMLTFTPLITGDAWGQIAMRVDPNTTPLCAQLPDPIALHGVGSGGGLSITTPSGTSVLTFPAPCDGTVPAAQQFTIANFGDKSFEWTMGAIMGPGAAQYQVSSVALFPKGGSASTSLTTQPGAVQVLGPGDSAKVTVKITQAMGSAHTMPTWTAPAPAALAGQIVVTTNVPGANSSAVISLSEIPIGDQLFASLGPTLVPFSSMDFGSAAVGKPPYPTRTFVITNSANVGSAVAKISYVVTPAITTVYSVTGSGPAPGQAATQTITFTPVSNATSPTSYPATLNVTTDATAPLCAPLPGPIALSGTGTQGLPVVSPGPLAFGIGPAGLVNCGATGTPQSFTVKNVGGDAFKVAGLAFAKGAASPFTVMPAVPPAIAVAAGQTQTFTVMPKAIPQSLPQPSDLNNADQFSDSLTVVTDAYGTPQPPQFTIALKMQAQGAVIVDSRPVLQTTWAFGTLTGSTRTAQIINQIQNIGTLPASVSLATVPPQVSPNVFGLLMAPTPVPPNANAATSIFGQFTVPMGSTMTTWFGDETLTVTADAFCEPLPAQWTTPAIQMSGSYTP